MTLKSNQKLKKDFVVFLRTCYIAEWFTSAQFNILFYRVFLSNDTIALEW